MNSNYKMDYWRLNMLFESFVLVSIIILSFTMVYVLRTLRKISS
jgi:uncharacterized membrane protein YesL